MWRMALSNPHFQIWHHIHTLQDIYTLQALLPSVLIFRHFKAGFTNAHMSGAVSEALMLMLSKPGSKQFLNKVQEICAVALLCTLLARGPQMASLMPSCPHPSAIKHISSEKSASHCKQQKSQPENTIWPHPFSQPNIRNSKQYIGIWLFWIYIPLKLPCWVIRIWFLRPWILNIKKISKVSLLFNSITKLMSSRIISSHTQFLPPEIQL